MKSSLPSDEFDAWATHYDRDVFANTGFPFEGYSQVLQTIVDEAIITPGSCVLDLGIGTGNLARLFANRGCEIWGLDFSAEMLAEAQKKLPKAILRKVDLQAEWPQPFQRKYDLAVSAYTFHHFPLNEKSRLIRSVLKENLAPGGWFIIGDITFQNAKARDALRDKLGGEWEEEDYWLVDETLSHFKMTGIPVQFIQISYWAGVLIFQLYQ
jgi:putative AdoMet-dependent methyltransferase